LAGSGGFEYTLALIGFLLPMFLTGPGRYAIGRFLPLPKSEDGRLVVPSSSAPAGVAS
jgi:hypothetical protein